MTLDDLKAGDKAIRVLWGRAQVVTVVRRTAKQIVISDGHSETSFIAKHGRQVTGRAQLCTADDSGVIATWRRHQLSRAIREAKLDVVPLRALEAAALLLAAPQHSESCWTEHHDCARAECARLRAEVERWQDRFRCFAQHDETCPGGGPSCRCGYSKHIRELDPEVFAEFDAASTPPAGDARG